MLFGEKKLIVKLYCQTDNLKFRLMYIIKTTNEFVNTICGFAIKNKFAHTIYIYRKLSSYF